MTLRLGNPLYRLASILGNGRVTALAIGLGAISGCSTPNLEYKTTSHYSDGKFARSEVAAISLNSSRPGEYPLLPDRINGEAVDYGGFGYVNTARLLRPGNYRIRFHFRAAVPGDTLAYLAPTDEVAIDAELKAGRTYIFVAIVDRTNKKYRVEAVDVGGPDIPTECLVLNLPNPPRQCFLYRWYPRPA